MDSGPTPISAAVEVPLGPEAAFEAFCDLGRWWPLAYTFAEAGCAGMGLDESGWWEVDDQGARASWGEATVYEPGRRLVLRFGIGPDRKQAPPNQSSEVEVRFLCGAPDLTQVAVEHRGFKRHGEGAEMLREGMASPRGWPLILAEFARSARRLAAGGTPSPSSA